MITCPRRSLHLLRGSLGDPVLDVALADELLRRACGGGPDVLRVVRPSCPTVAFSRRDALAPGFPAAVDAVRDAGFTPVLRPAGGRAVAFTERALVVDLVRHEDDALGGLDARFRRYGEMWADVLRRAGVDARVGEVPGEYCPGSHSVNARGVAKLVGTAQRVVRGAWLFSAVAVLDDADLLRPLLTRVYAALDLPFAPGSVGTVRNEAPGLDLDGLEGSVVTGHGPSRETSLTPDVLVGARSRVPAHTPV